MSYIQNSVCLYGFRICIFNGNNFTCTTSKTSFGNGLKAHTTDTMESFIILSYQVVVPTYHEYICKRCMEVHMEDHTGPVLSINVESSSYNINTQIL